jgi:hypothetical protein
MDFATPCHARALSHTVSEPLISTRRDDEKLKRKGPRFLVLLLLVLRLLLACQADATGGTFAAATPQRVGKNIAALPPNVRAFGDSFAIGPSRIGTFGEVNPPKLSP